MWICLALQAWAGDLYAGVDPRTVPVLGPAVFLEPGWSAPVLDTGGGRVRVFVAPEEGAAVAWLAAERRRLAPQAPPLPLGVDESWGNGHGLVLFREGNVAGWVERPRGGAADLAARLLAGLAEERPWPVPPTVEVRGQEVSVTGPWAQVAFRPDPVSDPVTLRPRSVQVVPTGPGAAMLALPPTRMTVVVWDDFGRTSSQVWTAP